ncbi:MAG: DUF3365 domain-containing protein [Rhodospirillales bacterium]|nr:DUF3365 domain-containing protein [Rhodospirillales bacterium]
MKPGLFFAAAVALASVQAAAPAQAQDVETRIAGSRAVVKAFGEDLRAQLVAALKTDGPVAAIEVCNMSAPEIARDQARATGWSVGRTSLKLRNPDNAPDAWESGVLESFEARKATGESAKALEHWAVVETDEGRVFRYMKAIPTGEPCLACHGVDLKPAVAAKLDMLYPEDRARGFAVGDIRGAFTIEQPM